MVLVSLQLDEPCLFSQKLHTLEAEKSVVQSTYTWFRLYGLRIYGLFGYMVNFWLVPNRVDFHTIENFGYMVWISDIWSIYELFESFKMIHVEAKSIKNWLRY